MMPGDAPVLIAACGNVMAGDDALGPLVAAALRRLDLPGVEVADLDLRPAALLDLLVRPRRLLIVVDAVQIRGAAAGALVDVEWFGEARPALVHDDVLSSHGLSIADQLELAQRLGMLPPAVRLIGAVIAGAAVGGSASPALPGEIDAVVARVRMLCAPRREEAAYA